MARFDSDTGCCEHCSLIDGSWETNPKFLLRKAARILDRTDAVADRAEATGDDRLGLQAQKELRASIELLMKANNMLGNDSAPVTDNRSVTNIFAGMPVEELRAIARALAKPVDGPTVNALHIEP